MKKTLNGVLAALMILSLLAGTAFAAETEDFRVIATEACELRGEPGSDGEVLGTLLADMDALYMCETAIDDQGVAWYYVDLGSAPGWVSSEFVEFVALEEGSAGCYVDLHGVNIIEATGGDSNIRTNPDREAEIVGLLKQGETAVYAGQSYLDYRGVRWDFVEFEDANGEGKDGWISSMYTSAKALPAE